MLADEKGPQTFGPGSYLDYTFIAMFLSFMCEGIILSYINFLNGLRHKNLNLSVSL